MKKNTPNKLLSALIALCVVFAMSPGLPLIVSASETLSYRDLVISLGSNESELIFSWKTDSPAGKTAIREAGGGDFKEFDAVSAGSSAAFVHKATVRGLLPCTVYEYKLTGENRAESELFTVRTGNPAGFSFIAAGDPQIATAADGRAWRTTLSNAVTSFPGAGFLISVGDQVDNYSGKTAAEYEQLLSPPELTGLPTAFAVGNHDSGLLLHTELFSFPNRYDVGPGITNFDYWFRYGVALFMVLDSNISDISVHKGFLEETVASNEDAVWKIVVFHHSLYSEGPHSVTPDIANRRDPWSRVLEEIGADAVISGHDHSYAGSFQTTGDTAPNARNQPASGGSEKSGRPGILYIALNSSSGSKYYDFASGTPAPYSSTRGQSYAPEFSVIDITAGSFIVSVYRTDTGEMTDTYTVTKNIKSGGTVFTKSVPAAVTAVAFTAVLKAATAATGSAVASNSGNLMF